MDELKELLGEAYVDGMSLEDVSNALKGKNLVDLSTGNYVDIKKHNDEMSNLRVKLTNAENALKDNAKLNENKNSENAELVKSLEQQLKDLQLENNKNTAFANLSKAKEILGIKDTDNDYANFVDSVSNLDKQISANLSSYIGKAIVSAYEKGKQANVKNSLGDMGKINIGGKSKNAGHDGSFGKELAQSLNTLQNSTTNYFERK